MHPAEAAHGEGLLLATLLQLIVIVLAARAANLAMRRCGQPGVVGEIIAGLLLGPSCFGALLPQAAAFLFQGPAAAPIGVLSQIGLILLMFQIGSEFHFGQLAQPGRRKAVAAIAAASLAVPLGAGLLLGLYSAPFLAAGTDRLVYSLFFAVAMAITAVPVLGRILREFGLTRTPLGVIAISAAAVNDVVGWVLLGLVSAFATARLSLPHAALQLAGIAGFALLLWYLGRPLADRLVRRYQVTGGTAEGQLPGSLMAIVLALLFAAAICTSRLGLFAIFGGFAVGLLFHRHRAFVEAWRRQVGQFVLVFFLPVFFTCTGLRTNLLGLDGVSDWSWCALIVLVAGAAKIVPVYFAARAAGMRNEDAAACGVLMNTRALMELVVLNIGLDLGFIPSKVFTLLVIMAVATTLVTAPLLRLRYRRGGQPLVVAAEA